MRKGIRGALVPPEDEPGIEKIVEADNGEAAYDRLKKGTIRHCFG